MNILLKHRIKLLRSMLSSCCQNDDPIIKNELNNIILQIKENKHEHFLSVSQDDPYQVSYCRKVEDKLNNTRRVRTTLGKYITKNLSFDNNILTESFLYRYVSNVWAEYYCDDLDVSIVSGKEIEIEYYNCDNHSHSCMTGENSDLVQLYTLNPKKISLVKYGPVRALLWTTDQGVKVIDRCYPSGHHYIYRLLKWGTKNGFVTRVSSDKCVIKPTVDLSDGKIYTVTLYHERVFPYLDTFCFGNYLDNNKIILSNNHKGYNYIFRSANGEHIANYYGWCYKCGEPFDDDSRTFEFNVKYPDSEQICTKLMCENCFSSIKYMF